MTCDACTDAEDAPRAVDFGPDCISCKARALALTTWEGQDIDAALRILFGKQRQQGEELLKQWRARLRAHEAAQAAQKGRR